MAKTQRGQQKMSAKYKIGVGWGVWLKAIIKAHKVLACIGFGEVGDKATKASSEQIKIVTSSCFPVRLKNKPCMKLDITT